MQRLLVVILFLSLLLVGTNNPAAAHPYREGRQCWATMSITYATYQLRDELSAIVQFVARSIGVAPGTIFSALATSGEFNYQNGTTSAQVTCP